MMHGGQEEPYPHCTVTKKFLLLVSAQFGRDGERFREQMATRVYLLVRSSALLCRNTTAMKRKQVSFCERKAFTGNFAVTKAGSNGSNIKKQRESLLFRGIIGLFLGIRLLIDLRCRFFLGSTPLQLSTVREAATNGAATAESNRCIPPKREGMTKHRVTAQETLGRVGVG